MALDTNRGIRWDGTVSLGAIIGAALMAIPIIGSAYVLKAQVAGIEFKVDSSFSKVETRLSGMEDAIMQLRLENAKRDGMAQEVAELKSRVHELEGKR